MSNSVFSVRSYKLVSSFKISSPKFLRNYFQMSSLLLTSLELIWVRPYTGVVSSVFISTFVLVEYHSKIEKDHERCELECPYTLQFVYRIRIVISWCWEFKFDWTGSIFIISGCLGNRFHLFHDTNWICPHSHSHMYPEALYSPAWWRLLPGETGKSFI